MKVYTRPRGRLRPRPRPRIRRRPRRPRPRRPRPAVRLPLPRPRPRYRPGGRPGRRRKPPPGAKYRYFGRYRAPPKKILGNPTLTLRSLKFARRNCQRLARMRRAWAFALRFGRQCYIAKKSPRKFTRLGLPRTKMPGALKVYVAGGGRGRSRPRPRPRPRLRPRPRPRRPRPRPRRPRPRPRLGRFRPRPKKAVWHYRYIGRFKSITPRRLGRYVGRMRGNKKVFECARRARRMRKRAFALRNRGDCYVSSYSTTYSTKKRLYGRFRGTTGQSRAIDAYVIGKGRFKPRPRPRKGGSVWHYRWLGRYRSLKARGLGRKLGRVTGLGRKKIFSCAKLARRMGYKAFALRQRRICYGTRSSKTYTRKPVIKGRFRAGAGGRRFIDAYAIGQGHYRRPLRKGRRGRSRKARQRRGRKRVRANRRKVRRIKRKRARIAKTRKQKRKINRRVRRLRKLRRKAMRARLRVRRLRGLRKLKLLRLAKKAKLALARRVQQMKRRIRARKLRLRRRMQRLRAARLRARMRRARRRKMRLLKLRMRRRLQKLRLLAQRRKARALKMARLQRQRRFRMLARLRARQRAARRRMMLQMRRRMTLLRRKTALKQSALRSRFKNRRQRAARLRTLAYRIRVRQGRARVQLAHIKRVLGSLSRKMRYYSRFRRYRYVAQLRRYRAMHLKRARNIRARWFRYQRQLAAVRRRQRMLYMRQRRALQNFRAFQRRRRLLFMRERQKLRKYLRMRLRRVRVGKKKGDIPKKKPATKKSSKTIKKMANSDAQELHSADFFWSFEASAGGVSRDAVQQRAAQLMGGSRVQSTAERGHVVNTGEARGWISLGDFKGKCFSDPDQCKHHGMTIMASLKLEKKHFHKKSSSYFLSSGGQTTKARGFAFLHLLNRYVVILSTKDKQWKLEARDILDGWANVAFTWEKNGLLKLYVNGKEVSSGKPVKVFRPQDSYSSLEVGRPNNSHSPNFRVPLEIDNIALWEQALTSKEISALAKKDLTRTSKEKKN